MVLMILFTGQLWNRRHKEDTVDIAGEGEGRTESSTEHTHLVQFSSVAQSCLTLCDPMDCSMPGFPVHHQLLELAQTYVKKKKPKTPYVHRAGDAIQPSCSLLSPSPPSSIFPSIKVFPMNQFFPSGGQTIGQSIQLQHESFQ